MEKTHTETYRSGCPVSLGLDIFGDRWTLLIVRDLMFGGKRHFREMLASDEHISTNILADRLKMLLAEGIISKRDDPSHQQKVVYSLTEKGIALLPILTAISDWSFSYRPVGEPYIQQASDRQGPADLQQEMEDLRRLHLPSTLAP
ncbi:helix-turn-helix transcriptional regulator (plasmid) [Deinococcus sp. KNUC1210]|uniref:winged helix-turn-helix transcriptional regulator n=1 Tax=Deinococcus sp. KNUC1210 TaxID=2917691 RepID=UPI001EF04832|nr:helix-turn-helix domain-containing protein [Deinococcus sp. KNUC1210]ULH17475.1 helix-turn-helix transcriptional regulator [Deinococcus sp. KNUC1210]